jgi:hypothetical protein
VNEKRRSQPEIRLVMAQKQIQSTCSFTQATHDFLTELAGDLLRIGFQSEVTRTRGKVNFKCTPNRTGKITKAGMKRLATHERIQNQTFIERMSDRWSHSILQDASTFAIENVKPTIVICSSRSQHDLFRYCRLSQNVASGPRVGRRICALVYDAGHESSPLMGAFCLASPIFSIGCRDNYFDWKGTEASQRKQIGLLRMMDLAVCVAIPPYNDLRGGKLIAALAASREIANHFRHSYNDDLLAVITTCCSGVHCPIFNRINLVPGGLFRRIGETSGYTTSHFSDASYEAARRLVGEHSVDWAKIRLLRTAMTMCKLPADVFLKVGELKGVYVGTTDPKTIVALRAGKSQSRRKLFSVAEITAYWRESLLKNVDIQPTLTTYSHRRQHIRI